MINKIIKEKLRVLMDYCDRKKWNIGFFEYSDDFFYSYPETLRDLVSQPQRSSDRLSCCILFPNGKRKIEAQKKVI